MQVKIDRSIAAGQAGNRSPATDNGILASLPAAEYEALLPELERVHIPSGIYLDALDAYFPTHGIVSLVYTNESGECLELAVVGHEGMCSVAPFLAGHAPAHGALVRASGFAYRLPARRLRTKFLESHALQRVLLAYAETQMRHISVIALCTRHHSLEKQLCRWLLQSLDRLPARELRVTHELIALLLGMRRQGITEAVSRLEKQGLIVSERGFITVTDYAGLLAHACTCYELLRSEPAAIQKGEETGRGGIAADARPQI
jgi:CRP-like cAMP-binding protein